MDKMKVCVILAAMEKLNVLTCISISYESKI